MDRKELIRQSLEHLCNDWMIDAEAGRQVRRYAVNAAAKSTRYVTVMTKSACTLWYSSYESLMYQ